MPDTQPHYLLHPGPVISRADGQRHHISATRLADLYRVPYAQCRVRPAPGTPQALGWQRPPGLIDLYPRADGRYALPVPATTEESETDDQTTG